MLHDTETSKVVQNEHDKPYFSADELLGLVEFHHIVPMLIWLFFPEPIFQGLPDFIVTSEMRQIKKLLKHAIGVYPDAQADRNVPYWQSGRIEKILGFFRFHDEQFAKVIDQEARELAAFIPQIEAEVIAADPLLRTVNTFVEQLAFAVPKELRDTPISNQKAEIAGKNNYLARDRTSTALTDLNNRADLYREVMRAELTQTEKTSANNPDQWRRILERIRDTSLHWFVEVIKVMAIEAINQDDIVYRHPNGVVLDQHQLAACRFEVTKEKEGATIDSRFRIFNPSGDEITILFWKGEAGYSTQSDTPYEYLVRDLFHGKRYELVSLDKTELMKIVRLYRYTHLFSQLLAFNENLPTLAYDSHSLHTASQNIRLSRFHIPYFGGGRADKEFLNGDNLSLFKSMHVDYDSSFNALVFMLLKNGVDFYQRREQRSQKAHAPTLLDIESLILSKDPELVLEDNSEGLPATARANLHATDVLHTSTRQELEEREADIELHLRGDRSTIQQMQYLPVECEGIKQFHFVSFEPTGEQSRAELVSGIFQLDEGYLYLAAGEGQPITNLTLFAYINGHKQQLDRSEYILERSGQYVRVRPLAKESIEGLQYHLGLGEVANEPDLAELSISGGGLTMLIQNLRENDLFDLSEGLNNQFAEINTVGNFVTYMNSFFAYGYTVQTLRPKAYIFADLASLKNLEGKYEGQCEVFSAFIEKCCRILFLMHPKTVITREACYAIRDKTQSDAIEAGIDISRGDGHSRVVVERDGKRYGLDFYFNLEDGSSAHGQVLHPSAELKVAKKPPEIFFSSEAIASEVKRTYEEYIKFFVDMNLLRQTSDPDRTNPFIRFTLGLTEYIRVQDPYALFREVTLIKKHLGILMYVLSQHKLKLSQPIPDEALLSVTRQMKKSPDLHNTEAVWGLDFFLSRIELLLIQNGIGVS